MDKWQVLLDKCDYLTGVVASPSGSFSIHEFFSAMDDVQKAHMLGLLLDNWDHGAEAAKELLKEE